MRAAILDFCRGLVRREFFIDFRSTAPIIAEAYTKIDRGLRSLASTHSIGGPDSVAVLSKRSDGHFAVQVVPVLLKRRMARP
jgi:hypothetical protein